MSVERVKDRKDEDIQEGDHVWTRYRGGVREGDVQKIVMDEREARQEAVANPPKVIFIDQHGDRVAHNPTTLSKTSTL
ncbi:hypothetical protein TMatcc_005964 [Talaromyces marneffei ATCC 18224]|uniref:uncharacterized protein n=1 Tax=Talaromyces marneffei TaxID=37727 RepID=UPI0012A89809|nr:uncharacterized protein EYB26_005541 [Talaromyces marneffei]KAE8554498.1 hypothetical protein EYB25_003037 [Talaromyces marneffei]QGA17865.1 hypothetical protein EYB26_005541 [Talaromyces marneffei]